MTINHGTVAGYNAGCRESCCRAAWAQYHRERSHRRGEKRPRAVALLDAEIEQAEAKLADVVAADADTPVTAPLSPLAFQILVDLQRKRRQRRGEIFEELLRRFGPDLAA